MALDQLCLKWLHHVYQKARDKINYSNKKKKTKQNRAKQQKLKTGFHHCQTMTIKNQLKHNNTVLSLRLQ